MWFYHGHLMGSQSPHSSVNNVYCDFSVYQALQMIQLSDRREYLKYFFLPQFYWNIIDNLK